jgi:uncharacterized protein (DUF433 family)
MLNNDHQVKLAIKWVKAVRLLAHSSDQAYKQLLPLTRKMIEACIDYCEDKLRKDSAPSHV